MTAALPLLAVGAAVAAMVAAVDELEVVALEELEVELDEPVVARPVPLEDVLEWPG